MHELFVSINIIFRNAEAENVLQIGLIDKKK